MGFERGRVAVADVADSVHAAVASKHLAQLHTVRQELARVDRARRDSDLHTR